MKFCNTFLKAILLIGLLGFCFSCYYEEPFPELPAETHTGEGTFGCLINNELVFALSGNWNDLNAGASYDQNIDQLRINAQCQFNQQFEFLIDNPYNKQGNIPIDTIRYSYTSPNSNGWKWITVEAIQTGSINFTRIDYYSNNVVSGTFSFDLNEAGKTPIHVTKGRFDLTFYSY